MSRRSEANLCGIPTRRYDLIREGLIVFIVMAVVIIVLAALFSSPDYPAVRGEDVAQRQPIAFLKTSANILAGHSSIQGYGPPYTPDSANAQHILGIAPAVWLGVTIPINPSENLVLKPLARVALLNDTVAEALRTYRAASSGQQHSWVKAYLAALDKATEANGQVRVPAGEYGPVGTLMMGMLNLGKAGLLEGALESGPSLPYTLDFTSSLLFFQDGVDHNVARTLDMLSRQWGISHENGNYPGAWWLWPYTLLYQIPPISTSPNGDLQAGAIMGCFFLVMLFTPFIPVLNRLPRWLGIYKLIWRDWYRRYLPESKAQTRNASRLRKNVGTG